ncbi:MAG: hypothetical protein M1147_12045 [Nitrospirae bacterium]|nr:hypothetical protein [Nitrospirota bacterium]MCL5978822.1 hypothetical protein [Nitrospirota bacterium]
MIDRQEFYHGAALIRLLDDNRCIAVKKHFTGYIVNNEVIVLFKYSTRSRTPWRFTFTLDEMITIETLCKGENKIVIALICGGDGICAVYAEELYSIMGDNPGWIAIKRDFNEQYGVTGPKGALERKISFKRWPSIIFDSIEVERGGNYA